MLQEAVTTIDHSAKLQCPPPPHPPTRRDSSLAFMWFFFVMLFQILGYVLNGIGAPKLGAW